MGVENGMFRSEIGSGFEDPGGTPPPRIPRSTPPPPGLILTFFSGIFVRKFSHRTFDVLLFESMRTNLNISTYEGSSNS